MIDVTTIKGGDAMLKAALALVAALLVGSPAYSAQKKAKSEAVKVAAGHDKKVCRQTVSTGSFLRNRECHSAAEWKSLDAESQIGVNAMRDRPRINGM